MVARLAVAFAVLVGFHLPQRAWAADDLFDLIRLFTVYSHCAGHSGRIGAFVTNAGPDARADRVVDQVVEVFRQDGGSVLVAGHRDTRDADGSDLRNAEAVAQLIVQRGVPPNRIWVAGRGDTEPLISGASETDAMHNRRVEITPTAWGSTCRRDYQQRVAESVRQNCVGDAGRNNAWECEVGFTILGGGVPPAANQWPPHVWQRRRP
ncbi:OmpA family protein [Roseomonas sp. CECT 9278]|uniref:OmpA family protein n=1 Tax=Roseomonas sp. CECT 9278 TaxID=2845823 RepID=UPI001E40CF16|nr:OmpA family protein [Roseomonas sp. CECT 9278]